MHGLPQALKRQYAEIDTSFTSKYSMKLMSGCPGATFCNELFLHSFLNDVKKQASDVDCEGQVNIVMLGSNDSREILGLPVHSRIRALQIFRSKVEAGVYKVQGALIFFPNAKSGPNILPPPYKRCLVGCLSRALDMCNTTVMFFN